MQFPNKQAITAVGLSAALFLASTADAAALPEEAGNQKDSHQEHFQSAQTFQIAGEYDKAAAEYRQAIARGLQHLGNLRISHDDYTGGFDLLTKSAEIAPDFRMARIDLGIAKFKTGDMESAKAEAEAVLKNDPQNVRALNLAGKVNFMQGEYDSAANRLQQALQLQPDFDSAYTLALANLELKKTSEAGVLFDEMLNSGNRSTSLEALIGIAYRETGYLDQAISHLSKSVALDPKSARAHSALGLAYFLKGAQEYPAARKEFLSAVETDSEDYTACYYLGIIADRQQNLMDADKWLKQALRIRPDDPDAHFMLGQVQFKAGDIEGAVSQFRKALTVASRENVHLTAQIHELLGDALEKQGMHSDAEREVAITRQLREKEPNDSANKLAAEQSRPGQQELRSILLQRNKAAVPANLQEKEYVKQMSSMLAEAYDNLGVIDARAARYDSATNEFSQAARWNPGLAGVDRNWGMAAFHATRYADAISPLQRHLRKATGDLAARETLGICYYMTDKFSEAASTFLPAIDSLSGNQGVLYAAGVSLAKAGDSKDANSLFSRMLRENPEVPEVHLLVGEARADLAEYDEALSELSRALELNPTLAEANYYKGIVRFKQGRMDDAAKAFQAELTLNPGSPQALYQLAVVRLSQRQTDEAVRLLTDVLEKTPANADARYQLGKAMLEKGDVKIAIENLEASVHLEPKDYSYYQLSLAYQRDGRPQEAKQALQMYESLKRKPPITPAN